MTAEIFGSTSFNAAGEFRGVTFSPDGAELLAVTRGEKRSLVRRFALPGGALLGEREIAGDWSELAVRPDGSWLLWSGAEAICITSAGKTKWKHASARGGGWLAVSPDRELISACANRKCTVLGAIDGKRRFEVKSTDELFTSAFSPDGQYLATGSQKGELRLYDGKGRELAKKQTTKVLALSFPADSKSLLSGHGNGDVALWNLPALTRDPKFSAAKHEFERGGPSGCRWVSFLSGGRAITQGNEHLLRVWSLANGKELSQIVVPARHYQGATSSRAAARRTINTR